MKVALLVFLFAFLTEANAAGDDKPVEECLNIKSFQKKGMDEKLVGQCQPSKFAGAFYTDDPKHDWECFETVPSEEQIAKNIKKKVHLVGICKFYRSITKKEDVPLCEEKPLQCAPGPKVNWGACVAKDVLNWKCIPQEEEEEGDIEGYVKGDCLALAVHNTNGKELYNKVCRFATEKEAESPKRFQCPTVPAYKAENAITCDKAVEGKEGFKSACFSTKDVEGNAIPLAFKCRKEEDSPCEWTISGDSHGGDSHDGVPPMHSAKFFDGECLFETHKDYAKALDWSKVEPKPKPKHAPADGPAPAPTPVEPEPTKTENGGIGAGWMALLVFLMIGAGGGGFLFWQRSKPTGPRELSGGLVR